MQSCAQTEDQNLCYHSINTLLYPCMASAASRLHVYSVLEHFIQALQGISIWELSNMTLLWFLRSLTALQEFKSWSHICFSVIFNHTHTTPRTSPGSRLCKARSKVILSELHGLAGIKGITTTVTMHHKMIRHACPSGNNLVSEKYLYYKKAPLNSTLKTCKRLRWSGTNKVGEGRDTEINLPPRQRSTCHYYVEAIESSEAAERLCNVCDHIWLYYLHLLGIQDKITLCIPAGITPGWLAKAIPQVLHLPAPWHVSQRCDGNSRVRSKYFDASSFPKPPRGADTSAGHSPASSTLNCYDHDPSAYSTAYKAQNISNSCCLGTPNSISLSLGFSPQLLLNFTETREHCMLYTWIKIHKRHQLCRTCWTEK